MKNVAKAFAIIGIVLGFVNFFSCFIWTIVAAATGNLLKDFIIDKIPEIESYGGLIGIMVNSLWLVLLICSLSYLATAIVSIIAYKKINNAKTKSELIPIAICCLILGNVVCGILTLCIREEQLN